MVKLPLLLLSGLMAAPLWAEGNRSVFQCTGLTSCNEDGVCVDDQTEVEFAFAPLDVNPDGAGTYELTYNGMTTWARKTGWNAPAIWWIDTKTVDSLHSLMAASQTNMVWHRLDLSEPQGSQTRFLECEDAS